MILKDSSSLSVTASIANALPHLARASQTGYLWIDQITINQLDLVERSNQVRIMGEIYGRCSRCLVWMPDDPTLGSDNDIELKWAAGAGDLVREFFCSFSDPSSGYEGNGTPLRKPSRTTQPHDSISNRALCLTDHLMWFFRHPWFQRTWVYQEFVLSPSTVFLIDGFGIPGDEILPAFKGGYTATALDKFCSHLNVSKARCTMFRNTPGLNFLVSATRSRMEFVVEDGTEHTFGAKLRSHVNGFLHYEVVAYATMLAYMGVTQAKDDRDHVYAFLGLAPCLLKHLKIDYALPVEHSFAAMMKAMVKESKSLDVFGSLHSAMDLSRSKLQLPSWVPDWTAHSPGVGILSHDNLFQASGQGFGLPDISKCKHTDPPESAWNEITVAGKVIDTIACVLRPFSSYQIIRPENIALNDRSHNMAWEKGTLDLFLTELKERSCGEDIKISSEALLRTLLMDGVQWAAIDALNSGQNLYRTGVRTFGLPHHKKAKDLFQGLIASEGVDVEGLPHNATLQTLHDLSSVQYKRRVAYCTNDRFAMTPDLTEKDDQIALLHGSRVPVVLRPHPSGKFTIIGQCFYDGAMYGEMADLDDDAADVMVLV